LSFERIWKGIGFGFPGGHENHRSIIFQAYVEYHPTFVFFKRVIKLRRRSSGFNQFLDLTISQKRGNLPCSTISCKTNNLIGEKGTGAPIFAR